MHFRSIFAVFRLTLGLASACTAQDAPRSPATSNAQDSSTSTDLFIMLGSDFVRPGLLPKANYNIGIGHTFAFLKKDPFGDELTFSYIPTRMLVQPSGIPSTGQTRRALAS